MKYVIILSMVVTFLVLSSLASASYNPNYPLEFSVHGKLTDINDNPLTGSYTIKFSIFDTPMGGFSIWSETRPVEVKDGSFSETLGASYAIYYTFNRPTWLQIEVGNETLLPRIAMTSSAYSLSAINRNGDTIDKTLRIYNNAPTIPAAPDDVALEVYTANNTRDYLSINVREGRVNIPKGYNNALNVSCTLSGCDSIKTSCQTPSCAAINATAPSGSYAAIFNGDIDARGRSIFWGTTAIVGPLYVNTTLPTDLTRPDSQVMRFSEVNTFYNAPGLYNLELIVNTQSNVFGDRGTWNLRNPYGSIIISPESGGNLSIGPYGNGTLSGYPKNIKLVNFRTSPPTMYNDVSVYAATFYPPSGQNYPQTLQYSTLYQVTPVNPVYVCTLVIPNTNYVDSFCTVEYVSNGIIIHARCLNPTTQALGDCDSSVGVNLIAIGRDV